MVRVDVCRRLFSWEGGAAKLQRTGRKGSATNALTLGGEKGGTLGG